MNNRKIDLSNGEEVVFESGPAILTNQRLLANWKGGDSRPLDEALLKDLESFEKFNGGQESGMTAASLFGAAGLALVSILFVIRDLPEFVSGVLFLLGAIGIVAGIYLAVSSLLRVRPHTVILFKIRATLQAPNKKIMVAFPGMENAEAEELTRRFTRLKRGL